MNKRHIYLADDDCDDRDFFVEAARILSSNIEVHAFSDCEELLDDLRSAPHPSPEVVFLDVNMIGKTGFDCLDEIKKDSSNLKGLKVVMLTTSRDPQNVELAFEGGASFYAVKPAKFESLIWLINRILLYDWRRGISKDNFVLEL